MPQIICDELDKCEVVQGSTFNRILVPFDDSKHATSAFGIALTLAKKFGASLSLVSIVQDSIDRSWVNNTPGREKGMSKSYAQVLEEKMDLLKNQAKKFQVHYDSAVITSGTVAESILSEITRRKIDFVIMGTRGKAMHKEMMLGRVSTQVALNASCPVLLVK